MRSITTVKENPRFSAEYLEADKRHIGNNVQVFFKDGGGTEKVSIDASIGHSLRRGDQAKPEATPVQDFMGFFAV